MARRSQSKFLVRSGTSAPRRSRMQTGWLAALVLFPTILAGYSLWSRLTIRTGGP